MQTFSMKSIQINNRNKNHLFSILLLLMLQTGCDLGVNKETRESLDKALKEIDSLKEQIKTSTEAAERIGTNMSKALDTFDPIILKSLWNSYTNLAQRNQALETAFSELTGGSKEGKLLLRGTDLILGIKVKGAVTLKAYVDRKGSPNTLLEGNYDFSIPLDYRLPNRHVQGTFNSHMHYFRTGGKPRPGLTSEEHSSIATLGPSYGSELDDAYQRDFNKIYSDWVSQNFFVTPSGLLEGISLKSSLGTETNTLVVVEANSFKGRENWSVFVEFFQISGTNSVRRMLKQFTLSNSTTNRIATQFDVLY